MRYLSLIQIVNFYSWRAISPHFYPQIFLKSHKSQLLASGFHLGSNVLVNFPGIADMGPLSRTV